MEKYESARHRGVCVNGILNYFDKARKNCEEAEYFVKSDLLGVWNPTYLPGDRGLGDWLYAGFDLAQVTFVNKMDYMDPTSMMVAAALKEILQDTPTDETVPLVLHSQGAAIGSAALMELSLKERARIDVTTIGGAAHGFPRGLNSVTMYINSRDVVPMFAGGGAPFSSSINGSEDVTTRHFVSFGSFPGSFETTHGIKEYFKASRSGTAQSAIEAEVSRLANWLGKAATERAWRRTLE